MGFFNRLFSKEKKETLDNGLERTVRWYLDKRGWVKDITDGDYRDYYRRMYGGE